LAWLERLSSPRARGSGFYYGWVVVAVSFTTHALTVGAVFYSFGVFYAPLLGEFGWTRAEVALGFSLVSLVGAIYSPWVGRSIDLYGCRPVQLFGVTAMCAAFLLLSRVTSLLQYYLCMGGVLALGSTSLGMLPSNTAVAQWFLRRRGRALGLATAGISMGGVIFVPLSHMLIASFGWRGAFRWLAFIVGLCGYAAVGIFMRRAPAHLPSFELGGGAGDAELENELDRSVTPAEAVRDVNFWLITAAFSLTVMGLSAILLHQIPVLIDLGVDPKTASFSLGATAGVGVIGKLGFGYLLDKFDQRRVILGCFLLQAFGLLLLPLASYPALLFVYVLIYGYAMGGNATLQATVVGECFGRLHYGAIAGRMSPFIVIAQASAVPLVGLIRDRSGSYGGAIGLIFGLTILAAMCISLLRQRHA